MTTMTLARSHEMKVLAAATTSGASAQDMRALASRLTDREYAKAVRDLITSGALVRRGYGATATYHRNLQGWHR